MPPLEVLETGNSGNARGGQIDRLSSQGGTITLSTEVTTGEIDATSEVGTIQTENMTTAADAFANAIALSSGEGGLAQGGQASASA